MASSTHPQLATLPQPSTLPTLPDTELLAILDTLFELTPALHDLALPIIRSTTYPSYTSLIASLRPAILSQAHEPDQSAIQNILSSHPRLGAKKVDSAISRLEQANLKASSTTSGAEVEDEATQLAALNAAYEDRYPGLRYVVFVNGRGRPEIMEDMKRRIGRGTYEEERDRAVEAMCDIANDRARKLYAGEVEKAAL